LCAARARADTASEARSAFELGVEASRAQRWEDARREFERSRDLVVKPSTLFNLAVADLKLGLSEAAIEALDAFERMASTSDHADMLERAKALRAEAERGKEAARPAVERARGLIEPSQLGAEAQVSFDQGHAAFARGDDTLALKALLEAYRLSGRDELLFDIGVVADRLRDDARAIQAFERFVRVLPELPEAELAQRHLDRLRRLQAQRSAAEPAATIERTEQPRALPNAPPVAPPDLILPRTLLVLGSAFTAGAIGTSVWLAGRQHDWSRCQDRGDACLNADKVTRQARAAWATTVVLGIGGLGLLTAGGVLLGKRKAKLAVDGVQAQLGPDGFALSTRLRF
jgi:tetratricopeptide (TPR) repeat protein